MIELVPAYGRTYINMAEARKDWDDGKDFKIFNGPYCSKRDLERMTIDYGKVVLVVNDKRSTLSSDVWGDLL